MLKAELTKNYTGITISGDNYDLKTLYIAIDYLVDNETISDRESAMKSHLCKFMHEVRYAHQGERNIELVDNDLHDDIQKLNKIKKKDATNKNIYYSFNYNLIDLIVDMILIKYFIRKIDKKNNNVYNSYLNIIYYFYSIVLDSLKNILTEIRFNKVKRKILSSFITDTIYVPQWFENVSIDYLNMNKSQREKNFMHVMDAIYGYGEYEEYLKIKYDVEVLCKEKKCKIADIHYKEYPKDIEW